MDAIEQKDVESKKLESVILDPATVTSLGLIVKQAEEEIGSLVNVTQKIVANFLIKNRSHSLSCEEMEQLKNENFDLVRALRKVTEQVLKAKREGNEIDLDGLVKIIQTPSVSKIGNVPRAPGIKKKKKQRPPLSESNIQNGGLIGVPESADIEKYSDTNANQISSTSSKKSEVETP